MTKIKVSIIIPSLNEPYLPVLLEKLDKFKNIEILVQTEKGLGNAVRKGIEKAEGDKIIIMDADGGHNPEYIPIFCKYLDKYAMVIGSRYVCGKDKRALFRRVISIVATAIVRLKIKNNVKDPLSGFFGFRKKILDNVNLSCNGFKIGLEIMMKTKAKLKEIPIVLEDRKLGKSKAGFSEFIGLMKLLRELT